MEKIILIRVGVRATVIECHDNAFYKILIQNLKNITSHLSFTLLNLY